MEIKISDNAYSALYSLLLSHKEYNCVRFSYISSCCSLANVEILLDEKTSLDSIVKLKEIEFVYSKELEANVATIELILNESNEFLMKCQPIKKAKTCSSCNNKASGCCGCKK